MPCKDCQKQHAQGLKEGTKEASICYIFVNTKSSSYICWGGNIFTANSHQEIVTIARQILPEETRIVSDSHFVGNLLEILYSHGYRTDVMEPRSIL